MHRSQTLVHPLALLVLLPLRRVVVVWSVSEVVISVIRRVTCREVYQPPAVSCPFLNWGDVVMWRLLVLVVFLRGAGVVGCGCKHRLPNH